MKVKNIVLLISCMAVFLWMTLIFNLSSQVREQSNQLSTGITQAIVKTVKKVAPKSEFDMKKFNHYVRKNAHFFAYFVLGILVMNVVRGKSIALMICIFYAISDEVHQIFVLGRGPQVRDVFIDSSGAAVGILMCLVIWRIKKVIPSLCG